MIRSIAATVFHARLRPRRNSFRYKVGYLAIPLSELSERREGLFSIDRRNLFSLRSADYGSGVSPARWIADVLQQWDIPQADGEVVLVTMPRVLGYVFNPVNFWFCYDRAGGLRAALAEVNNTFGERHCYLCFHEDRRTIGPQDTLSARKVFHVSPFMETKGTYSFRFDMTDDRMAVRISLADDQGPLLETSVAGQMNPLRSSSLLRALCTNPVMPLKVIALIHYQAIRLFLKRVRHIHKPVAPDFAITATSPSCSERATARS